METNGSVTFELRADKIDINGFAPIRLTYSLLGQRKRIATDVKLRPLNWDVKTGIAVYVPLLKAKKVMPTITESILTSKYDLTEKNKRLNEYVEIVAKIERAFRDKDIQYTIDMIIDELTQILKPETKKANPHTNIADWIEWYVQHGVEERKERTTKTYSGLANHLKAFEKATKIKATFEQADLMFFGAFVKYLNDKKKLNNTSAAKQISILKTLLDRARKIYKIEVNADYKDFSEFKRDDQNAEVIALTENELFAIINLNLTDNKKLDQQRDVFLFSASTGFRYSDLADLKRVHVKGDYIEKWVEKTKELIKVPLNPISTGILEKYAQHLKPLPIISNTKTTLYIKEVARLAGIDEPTEKVRYVGTKKVVRAEPKYKFLGIHSGRKSFVTYMLSKDVPAQDVMALSGHKKWASFSRYVDVAKKQKDAAMEKAFGQFKDIKQA